MSDPSEDLAAMFEASLKPKRFDRGQTIEGRVQRAYQVACVAAEEPR